MLEYIRPTANTILFNAGHTACEYKYYFSRYSGLLPSELKLTCFNSDNFGSGGPLPFQLKSDHL